MVCSNHPDRSARRRCFQCKTPICPDCQKKAYHHIFCGSACSEAYQSANQPKDDLEIRLSEMDESLAEDIREQSQAVFEKVQAEILRIEDELDKALTALATMVEGATVATGKDLEETESKINKGLETFQKTQNERSLASENILAGFKQVLLDARQSIFQLKDQAQEESNTRAKSFEKFRDELESIGKESQRRFDSFDKSTQKRLHKLHDRLGEHHDHLQRRFDDQSDTLKSTRDALTEEFSKSSKAIAKELEAYSNELDTSLKTQKESLSDSLQDVRNSQEKALSDHLETLSSRLKSGEEIQERELKELAGNLSKEMKDVSSSFANQAKALREEKEALQSFREKELAEMFSESQEKHSFSTSKLFRQAEDHLTRQEEFFGQQREELNRQANHIEKHLRLIAEEVEGQMAKSAQKMVDDMASLMVAQRGNWSDVVKAAEKGAEGAAISLREALVGRMDKEVRDVATKQTEKLGGFFESVQVEIRKLLRKRLAAPSFAFYALGFGLVLVFLLGGFFAGHQWTEKRFSALNDQISEKDETLRSWLAERLEDLQVAQKEPERREEVFKKARLGAVNRGSTSRKELAFTFDGGSNAKAAKEILNHLKKRGIRTTIFLTGEFMRKFPDLVRRIAKDGHEVGNHLLRHTALVDPKKRYTVFTKAAFLDQLGEVEKKYREITGKEMTKFWRAPFGELNKEVISWAQEVGYTHIGWTRGRKMNLDTLDWVADPTHRWYMTPKEIGRKILNFEKKDRKGLRGAIVLMHLGSERKKEYPHTILPRLFDSLTKKGYKFVKVSKILQTQLAKN